MKRSEDGLVPVSVVQALKNHHAQLPTYIINSYFTTISKKRINSNLTFYRHGTFSNLDWHQGHHSMMVLIRNHLKLFWMTMELEKPSCPLGHQSARMIVLSDMLFMNLNNFWTVVRLTQQVGTRLQRLFIEIISYTMAS